MRPTSNYHEISVELLPSMANRLKERSLGKRTLSEEAVRMMRYALRQMPPPRTPDEWKNFVRKEDWNELLHSFRPKAKENMDQGISIDQSYKVVLEVPSDMMAKIKEVARSKKITVSEAAVYTIEYALTEVFLPKTLEELDEEFRETWRGIFRAIFHRS